MASGSSNFLVSEAQLLLGETRRQKAENIKTLGSPIELPGKVLAIQVRGNHAWIAENTAVARKIDLKSGKTLQLYKGHSGPVTAIAFADSVAASGDEKILITGSWDKTIRLWDTDTKCLRSLTTDAHSDFVKNLLVIPSLQILVSSGSDKLVRFWDLAASKPLKDLGSLSSHTRPVECLAVNASSLTISTLYTADTMGIIRCWLLEKEGGESPRVKGVLQREYNYHRTRINDLHFGNSQLWTASSDETVQVILHDISQTKPLINIPHPVAVRSILPLVLSNVAEPYLITGAGDVLRVYDLSSPDEPELIREVGAHWHDITAIRLWNQRTTENDGTTSIEPWIITTSLDSTIRKWRLTDLLTPLPQVQSSEIKAKSPESSVAMGFEMTEEEERELTELLGD